MDKFKDFENEEIMQELNKTVEQAVTKTQAAKGEITALVLMNLPNIYDMAVNGATTSEICKRLGIKVRTYQKIKANNKQLQAVLEAAEKDMVDRVKQSLYHMTQPRLVKKQKVLANGKIVEFEEIIQPDPSLIKYYLNNKSEGEFQDKKEVAVKKVEYLIQIVDDDGNPIDCTPPSKPIDVDYEEVEDKE